MLAAGYVGGELVTVPAAVATHVAFERIAEAVAPHVDGEHDVVQEEHPAVATGVHCSGQRPGLPVCPHDPQRLEGRQWNVLAVWVWDAVLVIDPPQQVTQAVHDGLGHLGGVIVEGVHAEGGLCPVREAQKRHLVAVGEAHWVNIVAVY